MKILFLFIIQFQSYLCFIQLGYLGYAAVAATSYYAYKKKCEYFECCEYKKDNFQSELMKVYGQHIMWPVVNNAIYNHINKHAYHTPLVFLFAGSTGIGKTYTSSIIAENLYKEGLNSINVLKISPSFLFPNPNKKHDYKELIIQMLERQVNICPKSLIIIEEIDKLDSDLLEVFHPFLNNYNTKYNQMIYIFITNVGSKEIVDTTLKLYSEGKNRKDLKLQDYESILKKTSFQEKSSLQLSSLISSNLISYYIPFLPLEQEQIRLCLKYLVGYNTKREQFVIDQLKWYPDSLQLFATTGCKQIENKAAIYNS